MGNHSLSLAFFSFNTVHMTQVITGIAPTTELEAINAMLAAIGESPITDVAAATQADVSMAVNELRNVTRELQSNPWRFNFEYGLEVAPTTTILWTDSTDTTTVLNVFKTPDGVTAWSPTRCAENSGLDLVQRPGKQYQEDGVSVPILYDRAFNRDGANAEAYPFVYLDVLYAFDFELLPETARRLITVTAGRRFTQHVVGSQELAGFQQRDESIAWKNFMKDQADNRETNMLDTQDAFRILGQRPRLSGGTYRRVRPGNNPVPSPFRLSDLSTLRRVD